MTNPKLVVFWVVWIDQRVAWIAQSGKALNFHRRGPGFESRGQPYPQCFHPTLRMWTLVERLIHRVRACNWHYTCTSRPWHTQRFGRKKCRVVLPSRGPRLEKRREGCHVSKTWEYKEHLNGGVTCCRLWISLLGWEPGFSLWWLTYWQERDDNLCGEIGTSCNSSDWNTTCWLRVR